METASPQEANTRWSAPGLAARSLILGLMVFLAAGVALVPLGNRKLTNVFWVGAVVNLVLFCGVSLAAPIALVMRMHEQVCTGGRRALCILSFALGWLLLPCMALMMFAGPDSRITLPRWQLVLLFGMIAAYLLMAAGALFVRRRVE